VEQTLNGLLDAEADRLCGAGRYKRSQTRKDTRAGHYTRKLDTKAGQLKLRESESTFFPIRRWPLSALQVCLPIARWFPSPRPFFCQLGVGVLSRIKLAHEFGIGLLGRIEFFRQFGVDFFRCVDFLLQFGLPDKHRQRNSKNSYKQIR
jgi:hypothetical protein